MYEMIESKSDEIRVINESEPDKSASASASAL